MPRRTEVEEGEIRERRMPSGSANGRIDSIISSINCKSLII
jgi:hypothetical protein